MSEYKINAKFWTSPNVISIIRMILVIPLFYFLNKDDVIASLIIFVLAYISDISDGYIARKTNNISEWGKIIDPLADKVFVATAVIIMTINSYIPFWFAISVLGRDILILLAGLYATKKLKYTLPSNYTGKIAVLCIGATMVFSLLKIEMVFSILIVASIIMMALSLFSYSRRLIKELNQVNKA